MIDFPKSVKGILLTKRENVRWVSGFDGSFGLAILFKNREKVLISDGRYAERAEKNLKKGWRFQIFDKNFKKEFGSKLTGIFWIEDSTRLSHLKQYEKLFPHIKFRPKNGVIEKIRSVKTEEEIGKIRKAQKQVDKLLVPFLKESLFVGITEKALSFRLEQQIRDEGAFGLAFESVVAFGENTSIPHHKASERKLKKGDNILIDCGAKYRGYCSDMTRNFVFGKPNPEFYRKFQLCLSAQEKTLKYFRVGVKISDLDKKCRAYLGREAKYFTHGLGHGVGLEIHERPALSGKNQDLLEENQVVTCEPGIYYPGKFGIRIEDLMVIREQGPEILSQTPKELICFS